MIVCGNVWLYVIVCVTVCDCIWVCVIVCECLWLCMRGCSYISIFYLHPPLVIPHAHLVGGNMLTYIHIQPWECSVLCQCCCNPHLLYLYSMPYLVIHISVHTLSIPTWLGMSIDAYLIYHHAKSEHDSSINDGDIAKIRRLSETIFMLGQSQHTREFEMCLQIRPLQRSRAATWRGVRRVNAGTPLPGAYNLKGTVCLPGSQSSGCAV